MTVLCLPGILSAGPRLDFVKNDKQWPEQVQYCASLPGGAVFFTGDRFVYNYYSMEDMERIRRLREEKNDSGDERMRGHAYHVSFVGCNPSVVVSGRDKKKYYHNYFLGDDPSAWSTEVPVYDGVTYDELYAGIDLAVYSNGPAMKYDFIAAAGADPSLIRLQFNGVMPKLTREGALEIRTSVNTVTEQAPYVYQVIGGRKRGVKSKYVLHSNGEVGFAFPEGYDHSTELVIDPTLVFTTWTGATTTNHAYATAHDETGNAYLLSIVGLPGWPVTTGAYQTTPGNPASPSPFGDVGISKYNSTGTALLYATYLGGQGLEHSTNIKVNSNNELIVFGETTSANFPTTPGCYRNTLLGTSDFFIVRLTAAGSALLGSTLFGGATGSEESGGAVTIDNMGNILCAGNTNATDMPVTAGVVQSTNGGEGDIAIFKFDPTCTSLLFSTYLGGNKRDMAGDIQYKATGEIMISGGTLSANFPTTPGVIHPVITMPGSQDALVTVLRADATTLLYSTYLGVVNNMTHEYGTRITEDATGNIYVGGTSNSGLYPTTLNTYFNPGGTFFIQKLSPSLVQVASTKLGGGASFGNTDMPQALYVDECGSVCFAFATLSQNTIPVTSDAYQSTPGLLYVGRMNPDLTALNYGTYLGVSLFAGSGGMFESSGTFDPYGNLYATLTISSNAPIATTPGCFAPSSLVPYGPVAGLIGMDVALFKFNLAVPTVHATFHTDGNDTGCVPFAVQFNNTSMNAASHLWDFGDGTTSTAVSPAYTYTQPGTYLVKLIVRNPDACKSSDTGTMLIHVIRPDTAYVSSDSTLCAPGPLVLCAPSGYQTYTWQDGSAAQQLNVGSAGVYYVFSSDLCRQRTDTFVVKEVDVTFSLGPDTFVCAPYVLEGPPVAGAAYLWNNGSSAQHLTTGATGAYWLQVSKEGCLHADTAVVTYMSTWPNETDTTICDDLSIDLLLRADIPSGGTALWSTGSTAAEIRVQAPGAYWVKVMRGECSRSDTTNVLLEFCECPMSVPSAFSPNGDGRNDLFRPLIPAECVLANFTMSVYNRWGQRVYSSTDARKGWDGRVGGVPAEPGIYMYVVDVYAGGRGEHRYQKGDVMLVR